MSSSVYAWARAFRVLVGISMLPLSGVAMSAPTLVGSPNDVSGINGVVVDSVIYDVTFTPTASDATFNTSSAALAAANALASDLNTLSVTGLNGDPPGPVDCVSAALCEIFIVGTPNPPAVIYSDFRGMWQSSAGNFLTLKCPGDSEGVGLVCWTGTQWTKVTTNAPEPATLALFGLGLVGVGLSRRRLAH